MAKKRKDANGHVLKTGEYYNKSTKIYLYREMKDGQRVTITAKTLDELREKEKQLQVDLFYGNVVYNRDKNMTLNQYFDFWVKNIALSGKRKPTTITNYVSYYNTNICDGLGSKAISEITKVDCQIVFNGMIQAGRKRSTLANLKSCLNQLFECASDDGLIRKNPVKNIELPKDDAKPREDIPDSQINIFLEFVKNDLRFQQNYPFFVVLFNSGVRIGELAALTRDDVDFKNQKITINKTVNRYRKKQMGFTVGIGTPKSRTSNREIILNKDAMHILQKYMMQNPTTGYTLPFVDDNGRVKGEITGFVFLNDIGRAWVEPTVLKLIERVVEAQNESVEGTSKEKLFYFVPHSVRHTYGSIAYEAGADMKAVSQNLGHKSTRVTLDTYTHLRSKGEDKKKAVASMVNLA